MSHSEWVFDIEEMIQWCSPKNVIKKEPKPEKPRYASKRHIRRKVPEEIRKAVVILYFDSKTDFTEEKRNPA